MTKETPSNAADSLLIYIVSLLFFLFSDPSTFELNITDLSKKYIGHADYKKHRNTIPSPSERF